MVKGLADDGEQHGRLAQVERELQQEREARQQQERIQAETERITAEFTEATSDLDLTTAERHQLLGSVGDYALANNLTDMRSAFKAWAFDNPEAIPGRSVKPTPKPTTAISRKSSSAGSRPAAPPPPPATTSEAAKRTVRAFLEGQSG